MRLTTEQAYSLLKKRDCYADQACDKCGRILGPRRYTRKDESGEWCSRECRGDGHQRTIRKGGRPRKYESERDRLQAERRQNAERQKAFRRRAESNGKPSRSFAETKELRVRKTPLWHYPLTRTLPARKTGFSEGESTNG